MFAYAVPPKEKKQQEIYVGESRRTLAAEADIIFFSPTLA